MIALRKAYVDFFLGAIERKRYDVFFLNFFNELLEPFDNEPSNLARARGE